jgi:pilus assembly protein CpaF
MSGLEIPLSVCKQQVASAVELVVQLSRFPDGSRRIDQIVQVAGVNHEGFVVEPLFLVDETVGGPAGQTPALEPTGTMPRFLKKFARHNLEVPAALFQRQ